MVPQARRGCIRSWLDDDEVDRERQARDRRAIGEAASSGEVRDCDAQAELLAPIDRLLGQAMAPSRPPADLDADETRRRNRVDGHEIELQPSDAHMAAEDRPSGAKEVLLGSSLGIVAEALSRGPACQHPGGDGLSGGCAGRQLRGTRGRSVEGSSVRAASRVSADDGQLELRVAAQVTADVAALQEVGLESEGRLVQRLVEQVERGLITGEGALQGEEAPAMERRQALATDRRAMIACRVTLVVLQP